MLISMPTGTSTILGVFQAISISQTDAARLPHELNLRSAGKFATYGVDRNCLSLVIPSLYRDATWKRQRLPGFLRKAGEARVFGMWKWSPACCNASKNVE
jgi:hypothetical protein